MARKRKQGIILHLNTPTARVRVDEMRRHPVYGKQFRTSTSILSHVPADMTVNLGDIVTIEETRPFSKNKSWQIVAVIKSVAVATTGIEEQA